MIRSIIPVLLLSTLWGLPDQTQPRPSRGSRPTIAPEQAADPLQEAEGLLQKQEYSQAEEALQPLIAAQAKNPQFWFDLGFARSHQSKSQAAVEAYRKAVELAPDWFEANLNLGVDLVKSGDRAGALAVLKHAVELKPVSGGSQPLARAWILLAQASEESDLRAAAAAYDKAAELNPADTSSMARAGSLLQKSGDMSGAEQHYQKAAAAGNAAAMAELIDLLIAQQRYADAAGWLRDYADRNPDNVAARVHLARLLAKEGKVADAIATLEPWKERNPGVERLLGELYLDNKQYAQAAPLLQQALGQNQTDPQLHLDLGMALLHQLKYAEAESELLRAIQLKPDLAEAYFDLAYAAQQNKH